MNVGYDDLTEADLGAARSVYVGSPQTLFVQCDDLMVDSSLNTGERAWMYEWDCVLANGRACPSNILLLLYSVNQDTVNIPEGYLDAVDDRPTVYNMTVRVSREPIVASAARRRSAFVLITVNTIPTVTVTSTIHQIKSMSYNLLDTTLETYLTCAVDADDVARAPSQQWPGVTANAQLYYKWTLVEGYLDGGLDANLDPDVGDSTSPELLILPYSLIVGATYIFRCNALLVDPTSTEFTWDGLPLEDGTGATGQADSAAKDINGPPSGGSAQVSPLSGEELIELFTVTATGWTDPDGGLMFAFYWTEVEDPNPNADLIILVGDLQSTPKVRVAPRCAKRDSTTL